MLHGPLGYCGYDWWWHSFTAQDVQTGDDKAFFIEFFICNPALAEDEPVLGQLPANRAAGKRPSYLMVKAGCWGKGHVQLHLFSWPPYETGRKMKDKGIWELAVQGLAHFRH